FFFSSRRRHTRSKRDWSSDVCSSDLVEVGLAQPPLEEGAGVHPRRGMALEEDLVAAAWMVLAAEEVVEPDLVEGGGSRVGGDVRSEERRVGREGGAWGEEEGDNNN